MTDTPAVPIDAQMLEAIREKYSEPHEPKCPWCRTRTLLRTDHVRSFGMGRGRGWQCAHCHSLEWFHESDPAVLALIDAYALKQTMIDRIKEAYDLLVEDRQMLYEQHAALVARIRDIKVQSDEEDRRVVTPHGSSFGRCKHDAAALAALVAEAGEL